MGNEQFLEQHPLRSQSLLTKIHRSKEAQIIKHIQEEKLDLNQPLNNMGDTLGHFAAYNSQYEVLSHLLKHSASFDIPNTRGITALDIALPQVREWLYDQMEKKKK